MRYIKPSKTKSLKNIPTILFDDRERDPWMFISDYWPMERKRLKVGDYTIKGLEEKFAIEKKSGLLEVLTDLSAPSRKRFERFLEKLSKIETKIIIVPEPLTNKTIDKSLKTLHKKSGKRSRLTTKTVTYWTSKITGDYGIPILFLEKSLVKPIVLEIIKGIYLSLRGE